MPIDSHVQMPSSIQRGFSIKGKVKETFVYKLETDSIDPEVIKKNGTIFAYYNNEAEESLEKVEADFGRVKSKIRESFKQGKTFSFSNEDLKSIKIFLTMSLGRNRTMVSTVTYKSIFCRIFNISIDNSNPILSLRKIYPNGEFFDGYSFSILTNSTQINFVCPENCLFSPLHFSEYTNGNSCIIFQYRLKLQ